MIAYQAENPHSSVITVHSMPITFKGQEIQLCDVDGLFYNSCSRALTTGYPYIAVNVSSQLKFDHCMCNSIQSICTTYICQDWIPELGLSTSHRETLLNPVWWLIDTIMDAEA